MTSLKGFGVPLAQMRMLGPERRPPDPATTALVPGVAAGVRGVAFIAAAIESSRRDAAWVGLEA